MSGYVKSTDTRAERLARAARDRAGREGDELCNGVLRLLEQLVTPGGAR